VPEVLHHVFIVVRVVIQEYFFTIGIVFWSGECHPIGDPGSALVSIGGIHQVFFRGDASVFSPQFGMKFRKGIVPLLWSVPHGQYEFTGGEQVIQDDVGIGFAEWHILKKNGCPTIPFEPSEITHAPPFGNIPLGRGPGVRRYTPCPASPFPARWFPSYSVRCKISFVCPDSANNSAQNIGSCNTICIVRIGAKRLLKPISERERPVRQFPIPFQHVELVLQLP
jgi:hypothetical protein